LTSDSVFLTVLVQ